MARQIKEHKTLHCKITMEVSDMLTSFSEETGLSKTATVEKALKKYIKDYNRTGKLA